MEKDAPLHEVVPWLVAVVILGIAVIGHVTWYLEGYRFETVESRYSFRDVVLADSCDVSAHVVVPREQKWWKIGQPKNRRCGFLYGITGGDARLLVLRRLKTKWDQKVYELSPGKPALFEDYHTVSITRLREDEPVTFYVQYYNPKASAPIDTFGPEGLLDSVLLDATGGDEAAMKAAHKAALATQAAWRVAEADYQQKKVQEAMAAVARKRKAALEIARKEARLTGVRADGTVAYIKVPTCSTGWSNHVRIVRGLSWKERVRAEGWKDGRWKRLRYLDAEAVRFCGNWKQSSMMRLFWEGEAGYKERRRKRRKRRPVRRLGDNPIRLHQGR